MFSLTKTFQIEQPTNLSHSVVLERIFWVLKDRDYRITNRSEKLIIFDDRSGKLKWQGSPTQLEYGIYQITEAVGITTVKLTYTMSFNVQIVMLSIILVIAILSDPFILYLAACVVLFSIIHFFSVKNEAKELLLNAADGNVVQPD